MPKYESVKVNINDDVWVKLTPAGKKRLEEEPKRNGAPYKSNRRGEIRFQLWDLMYIFGPKLHNGCDVPFVKNEIRIDSAL